MQNLRELEEVIDYNECKDDNRKSHLYDLWVQRFNYLPTSDIEAM